MNLYRFHYSGGHSMTFAASAHNAILWAHRFARYSKRELVGIQYVRPIQTELKLA